MPPSTGSLFSQAIRTKFSVRRRRLGVKRLEVAPNVQLADTPEFPAIYKAEALDGRAFLNAIRAEKELGWTFLSPSALSVPGVRTGKFRLGRDELLIRANGESKISMEDIPVVKVDELENPKHPRQRFTVG
jgi:uncharacterized protein